MIKYFTGNFLYLVSLAVYLSLRAIIEIMKFHVCLHLFDVYWSIVRTYEADKIRRKPEDLQTEMDKLR